MTPELVLLILVVGTALAFDFTNGFHDTANAMATAKLVKAKMAEMEPFLPAGVKWSSPYDTSKFVKISIEKVVHTLLEGKAHPMTVEILDDLVQRRWSKPHDIANAVEDFGVDAMMYYADATGTTMKVSVELAELHSALLNMPVVRTGSAAGARWRIDVDASGTARIEPLGVTVTIEVLGPLALSIVAAGRTLRVAPVSTIMWTRSPLT